MALFCKKNFSPVRFPPARFSQSVYRFPRRLGSPSGAPVSRARRQPGEGKAALDQPRKGRKKEALNLPNALRPDCPLRKFRGQQNSSEDSESTEGTEGTESTRRNRICRGKPNLPKEPRETDRPILPKIPNLPNLPNIPREPKEPNLPRLPNLPNLPIIPNRRVF